MRFLEREDPHKITDPRVALAHVTIELGSACEYHDLEGYNEAIQEAEFAAQDLARYRQIRSKADIPDAERELQRCSERLAEANGAYDSSKYQDARKALALASVHLDRYLQALGPSVAYLREDLLPLITDPGGTKQPH